MIPRPISQYLHKQRVPHLRRQHGPAPSAQSLAQQLHVSGHRVGKCVLVEADGQPWIAVLPAPARIDAERLRTLLKAREVRLANEQEYADRFADCEEGAEPPFGRLFGVPVVVDDRLSYARNVWFPAGKHDEAIELRYRDFCALEWPVSGSFSTQPGDADAPRIRRTHAQA